MNTRRRLGLLRALIAAEGWRSVGRRTRAHLRTAHERRRFSRVSLAELAEGGTAAVLQVLPSPPFPWRGGVEYQAHARLAVAARHHDVAALFPWRNGARLEVTSLRRRSAVEWPVESLSYAAREAIAALGCALVHIENLAGLAHAEVLSIANLRPFVLSLHDFSAYCRRPHLLEHPQLRFCDYSRDLERCTRCLSYGFSPSSRDPGGWRREASEILRRAVRVVHPTDFLRLRILDLFQGLDAARHLVIAPEIPIVGSPPTPRRAGELRVAAPGATKPEKGSRLLGELLARMSPREAPVEFFLYGGGEPREISRLRLHSNLTARGFYEPGSLSALLHRDRIDVALLLSPVPESYGLTLDECRASGVPVVSLATGALGDRLRGADWGRTVRSEDAVESIRGLLLALAGGADALAPPPPLAPEYGPERSYRAWLACYYEVLTELAGPLSGSIASRDASSP